MFGKLGRHLTHALFILSLVYRVDTKDKFDDYSFLQLFAFLYHYSLQKFKDTYLQFLTREGFPQFQELVDNNIKSRKSTSQSGENELLLSVRE